VRDLRQVRHFTRTALWFFAITGNRPHGQPVKISFAPAMTRTTAIITVIVRTGNRGLK
jgi:hypothetical protein